MRITDIATKHRTSVVVMTVILAVGGLYSYIVLPKESNPSIEVPYINVTTFYLGASPDDVAELITKEIEQEIKGITGIKEIRSTSTEGLSSIVVEFHPDVPIDEAEQEVRDQVDAAKPDLPTDAEDPVITEIDFSEFPIMTVNLAANYSLTRLKELAEDLTEGWSGRCRSTSTSTLCWGMGSASPTSPTRFATKTRTSLVGPSIWASRTIWCAWKGASSGRRKSRSSLSPRRTVCRFTSRISPRSSSDSRSVRATLV
jgi:hypothetical protein